MQLGQQVELGEAESGFLDGQGGSDRVKLLQQCLGVIDCEVGKGEFDVETDSIALNVLQRPEFVSLYDIHCEIRGKHT